MVNTVTAPDQGPVDWNPAIDRRFPEYADLIRRYVKAHRDRCRQLSNASRRWFRWSGVAVILFSVSLPVLSGTHMPGKDGTVSALALAIAGISSLRGFFQWDQSWRLYRQQDVTLSVEIARWEAEMLDAAADSGTEADARARATTHAVLQRVQEAGKSEFDTFFTAVTWPERSR